MRPWVQTPMLPKKKKRGSYIPRGLNALQIRKNCSRTNVSIIFLLLLFISLVFLFSFLALFRPWQLPSLLHQVLLSSAISSSHLPFILQPPFLSYRKVRCSSPAALSLHVSLVPLQYHRWIGCSVPKTLFGWYSEKDGCWQRPPGASGSLNFFFVPSLGDIDFHFSFIISLSAVVFNVPFVCGRHAPPPLWALVRKLSWRLKPLGAAFWAPLTSLQSALEVVCHWAS
jgi:hypothetical protein